MSELLTYGSVGGVGRKPGPYPAANQRQPVTVAFEFERQGRLPLVAQFSRWAKHGKP